MYHADRVFFSRSLLRMSVILILPGAFFTPCVQAQQAPASQSVQTVVTCVSAQGERKVCKAETAAGVALLRSTGTAACLLGKTWGYDDAGIWVSDGCGGEFAVGSTKEASGASNFIGMFEAYGQFRIHLAAYRDDLEVQDNASRIGLNFATRSKIQVFAKTEWGVNLVQSSTDFNLSATQPGGDFGALTTTTNPVFYARLGYIGVDFGPFGKVAIGKHNAVHYDITSYTTDRFNVFGGQGTQTYVAGTDGGSTGTGRADRVVNYHNTFLKIFEVGAQGQFRAVGNDHTSDGGGGSLQVTVLPGVKIGGAYTRTNWSPAQQELLGLGGNSDYMAVGGRADWRMLEFGLVYSHQHNGDLVYIPVPNTDLVTPVVFDASGLEVFARAGLGRFGIISGYTTQNPERRSPLLNPNFLTRYFILGGEWFITKNAKIYTESKLDLDSVSATGEPGFSVFTIGFRYDFSWRTSHQP